jgi:hypothetical protein
MNLMVPPARAARARQIGVAIFPVFFVVRADPGC